jgi:hypothetical protein
MMRSLYLLLLCALPLWLGAQATHTRVLLRGGSVIQGTVLDTGDPNYMHIRLPDSDSTLLIPAAVVQRIIEPKGERVLREGYDVPDQGWYKGTAISFMAGLSYFEAGDTRMRESISAQAEVGYYFRNWCSVGVGVGADHYDEWLVPVFAHVRLLMPNRPNAAYLSLQGGRSIAAERVFVRSPGDLSRGRWMWHPSVGVRLATRRRMAVHIDAGYKFQYFRLEQTFDNQSFDPGWGSWWWWGVPTRVREDRLYKSFVLRLGATF